MFETHTTKDGSTILICQMDDRHLANTIKAYCREIEKCRLFSTQPTAENQMIAIFNSAYSQANVKAQAERELKRFHERLQPYLGEALLRGLNLSKELKVAYGRTGQVTNTFNVVLELPPANDDWDNSREEWEIEHDTSHPGHPSNYGDH